MQCAQNAIFLHPQYCCQITDLFINLLTKTPLIEINVKHFICNLLRTRHELKPGRTAGNICIYICIYMCMYIAVESEHWDHLFHVISVHSQIVRWARFRLFPSMETVKSTLSGRIGSDRIEFMFVAKCKHLLNYY